MREPDRTAELPTTVSLARTSRGVLLPPLPPEATPRLPLWGHLALLLFYYGLCLPMLWPMPLHPGSIMLGSLGDAMFWPWNLSWFREAMRNGTFPWFGTHLYPPFDPAMLRHSHVFAQCLLYTVVGGSPYLLINLLICGSFVLCAHGTYLLAREITGKHAGAIAAGVVFSFCSFRVLRAQDHFNILCNEWVPYGVYALLRWGRGGGYRPALGAGLCLAGALWTEYYQVLFLGLFLIGFMVMAHPLGLLQPRPPGQRMRSLLLASAVTALLVAPFVYGLIITLRHEVIRPETYLEGARATALSYLFPSPHHSLWGAWFWPGRAPQDPFPEVLFFGYAAMAAAAAGLRTRLGGAARNQRAYLALMGLLFLLLSLGPSLPSRPTGWHIPLPYRVFMALPGLNDYRIPGRFGVMVALCAAVLAALGYERLLARWQATAAGTRTPGWRTMATAGFCLLALVENLHAPWPLRFVPWGQGILPQRLLTELRRDRVPGRVMKIPLLYGDFWSIWLQTWHLRPAMTGALSRRAPDIAPYYERFDLRGWFRPDPNHPRMADDPLTVPNLWGQTSAAAQAPWPADPAGWSPQRVADFCAFFDLRALLFPAVDTPERFDLRLRRELLPIEREMHEGPAVLYFLRKQPTRLPLLISAREPSQWYYFGRGFSEPQEQGRRIVDPTAGLVFRLDEAAATVPRARGIKLNLTWQSEGDVPQGARLALTLQQAPVASMPLYAGKQQIRLTLPRGPWPAGYYWLNFQVDRAKHAAPGAPAVYLETVSVDVANGS